MTSLNRILLTSSDLELFKNIGIGSFLFGNPPTAEKPELDVALIFPNSTNIEEERRLLEEKVRQFEEKHGLKVDGWIMTLLGWIDRQSRIFGSFPHEPMYVDDLETWDKPAYLPLWGKELIMAQMNYCKTHPVKEGILPPAPENRFGSGTEAK
ncbi:hypothetical protein HY214_02310 [Candidatus Roizmanbacteria bacterium]|nr:hypothetical protein [Candidatus Roizmanbacteria bacterium]